MGQSRLPESGNQHVNALASVHLPHEDDFLPSRRQRNGWLEHSRVAAIQTEEYPVWTHPECLEQSGARRPWHPPAAEDFPVQELERELSALLPEIPAPPIVTHRYDRHTGCCGLFGEALAEGKSPPRDDRKVGQAALHVGPRDRLIGTVPLHKVWKNLVHGLHGERRTRRDNRNRSAICGDRAADEVRAICRQAMPDECHARAPAWSGSSGGHPSEFPSHFR